MADIGRTFAWVALLTSSAVIVVSAFTTRQIRQLANTPPAPLPVPVASVTPPEPLPEEPEPEPELPALPPSDLAVLAWLERTQFELVRTDVTPDQPFRVDLVGEGGRVSAARVDLDRDGQWDERWRLTLPGSQATWITKEVSPNDDGTYSQRLRLKGGRWELDAGESGR